MATLSSNVLTISDWAKRLDPKGKTSVIVELLSQTNRILDDAMWKEGNLHTGEQVTIRTGLPDVYYRLMNQGTPTSKSTTAQVTEQCASLEARCETDVKVAKLNGNVKSFRFSESKAFIEAMNQKQATTMFYGSAANPEEYVGLANRYSDTSAANGENILSAGGSGSDNTSMYLVGWGGESVYGVFPKGSKAGLSHQDLGEGDAFDSGKNRFRAYMDLYEWDAGLVVKDWRNCVRIPNIAVSDLKGKTGTQASSAATNIINLLSQSIDRLPSPDSVNPAFYCNRTVLSHLRLMGLDKSSSVVTIEQALNQFGKTIYELRFLGIPVRLCDKLTNSESAVS